MKIIKTKTEYKNAINEKGKKTKKAVVTENEMVPSEVIDFSVNLNGEITRHLEERIELLEFLLSKVIDKNPELFRDYIEVCVGAVNRNTIWRNEKYSIKDELS